MGRQESPQLIERKGQVDTDAQETSRASNYHTHSADIRDNMQCKALRQHYIHVSIADRWFAKH